MVRLLSVLALTGCRPTCESCRSPSLSFDLVAVPPATDTEAKGELPEGRYEIAYDTGRVADTCAFTLAPTGCPDGQPNCVTDSTCPDTSSAFMDFGDVVRVFSVGMTWPGFDPADETVHVTVSVDGDARVDETYALTWLRNEVEPGPYSVRLGSCWCDFVENPPFAQVPAE